MESNSAITPQLIEAVIQIESGGRANAVSHKGALGLMQVMPSTGKSMGYSKQALLDPETNIEAGTRYLTMMYEHTGSVEGALAAYYCGPRNHKRKVCRAYANKVMRAVRTDKKEPANDAHYRALRIPY